MAVNSITNSAKFPFYVFNPRHGMTINHRTADFLRYFLEKRLPGLCVKPPAEKAPYIYRTLVCRDNLKMGLISFASLAASAKRWPKIEMLADESVAADDARKFFGQHGISVEVWTPARLIGHMNDNGEKLFRRFAEAFFWGRKTAFTFAVRQDVPILYADLDILWFKDPWEGLDLGSINCLLAAEDRFFTYNKGFMPLLSPEHQRLLLSGAPHCAGLYAVPPQFRLPDEVLHYISTKLDVTPPGYHYEEMAAIEQTCLGLATKLKGRGIPWEILPTCPDESWRFPAFHGKNWVAAHYAGPTRRQFWRDAWSSVRW
jgi:hypothetical protein